jgi:hypothetical protein
MRQSIVALRFGEGFTGTLPSGGSTTKELCRVESHVVPLSAQIRSAGFAVAFFSRAAASWSVMVAFPASSGGRSKGVRVALVQTPCRSGWPSGVRVGLHVFVDADGLTAFSVCAWTGAASMTAAAITAKPPAKGEAKDFGII